MSTEEVSKNAKPGSLNLVKAVTCFGGRHCTYTHESRETGCPMRFSVFFPKDPQKADGSGQTWPALYFLSGLTCTDENVGTKSGAQRYAAEHGVILIMPDTSPRGLNLPGEDDSYDFGSGAGFYVDATEAPWSKNYRMYSYVTKELPALIAAHFPIDDQRQGIFGHSMGGHGALVIGLRNPKQFASISAFSPICAPMRAPWGEKAFSGYLGADQNTWKEYDATELIAKNGAHCSILVDQGTNDEFIDEQLKPHLLEAVCERAKVNLTLRRQAAYDHSYFFISTFIGEHIAWHAEQLALKS